MKILLLDSGMGLIPFINEIIKLDKKNTYYLFMDHQYFPYGNKSETHLKKRLKYLLTQFEKLNLDSLLICCNTLSYIYRKYQFKTSYRIKTILDLNLKHLGKASILVTPALKRFYKDDERFIACNLATSIENGEYISLIKEIKSFSIKNKVILGCTHYPLAKPFFNHYTSLKIVSYENEFVSKISNGDKMVFYGRNYEIEIFKKYFPTHNIIFYFVS